MRKTRGFITPTRVSKSLEDNDENDASKKRCSKMQIYSGVTAKLCKHYQERRNRQMYSPITFLMKTPCKIRECATRDNLRTSIKTQRNICAVGSSCSVYCQDGRSVMRTASATVI